MSKKLSEKNIVTSEKSEKFFLVIGECLWYNRYNPRKQKAFEPYNEAEESLALNRKYVFPWKKGGGNDKSIFV